MLKNYIALEVEPLAMLSRLQYNKMMYSKSTYSAIFCPPYCSEYGPGKQDNGELLAFISPLYPPDFCAWRHPPTSFPGGGIP